MTKVRVLIAEDSEAMRMTLETLLASDPRIEVIGTAHDGLEALERVKTLRPQVVTMDVMMPHLDGVGATIRIMQECPVRILMVSSYADDKQIDLSFRAIAAGALEVVAKPKTSGPADLRAWARRVCDTIVLMAEVPVITRARRASIAPRRIDIAGIAASTGGPLALAQLLGALPAEFPIPLLVAQHIADGFTAGLVRWLSTAVRLPVQIAIDGTAPRPGNVYFAPDGRDLEIGADGSMRTPAASSRNVPSGDILLASLAQRIGARAAGLVLTGMGEDGAVGLLAIRNAGGVTFAQAPASCVVDGMPRSALARGATSDMRTPEGLAAALSELVGPTRKPIPAGRPPTAGH
jgi:two-component system chemotaxis response regulator CheB